MTQEELVVHGAREHNLKDVTVRLPRNALVCITGLSGLRQVVAWLRHDLRRGPAPLRRVALGLRAPVPADDGEARRRLHRRALAGDLDRPEDDLAQPALDGRHGHRDLRLPAPALRARRAAALPRLRPADRRQTPEQIVDQVLALPEGTRFTVIAPVVRDRKGEYKDVFEELRARRLHAREGRRRAAPARGGDRRSTRSSSTRSRWSSTASCMKADLRHAPRAVDRDRRRARRGPRRASTWSNGEQMLFSRELRLPRPRRLAARARAAHLLVQLAARRLPGLHRARLEAGDRPRPARPRPDAVDRRGRARAVVGRRHRASTSRSSRRRRPVRDRPGAAVAGAVRRAAEPVPATAPAATGSTSSTGTGMGRKRSYMLAFEGIVKSLERRYKETDSAQQRERIEEYMTLPRRARLQRRAAQARGAGRHGRRPQHPRVHADLGRATRSTFLDGLELTRGRAADRRADHQGDPRAARLPGRRRPRLPHARPRGARRSRAARRSGSGSRRRSARSSSASSTSSTSRRSASTSATTTG